MSAGVAESVSYRLIWGFAIRHAEPCWTNRSISTRPVEDPVEAGWWHRPRAAKQRLPANRSAKEPNHGGWWDDGRTEATLSQPWGVTVRDISQEEERSAARSYQELNHRLYSSDPADYFRRRLQSVRREVQHVEAARATPFDEVRRGTEASGPGAASDHELRDRYVAIESLVLLHQVAETVVRWHLAHVSPSPCPWLELSAERHSARFNRRVAQEILDLTTADLHDVVGFVYFGGRSPADARIPIDEVTRTATLLRSLAARFLADGQVYNASKHGMALIGGGRTANRASAVSGPALATVAYLSASKWADGRRDWTLHVDSQDVAANLALVEVGADMLEALWLVARVRYLSEHDVVSTLESGSEDPSAVRAPDPDMEGPAQRRLFTEHR